MPLPQHLPFCGAMEEACLKKAMEVNHGCQVKCTGLYADVWYSEEDNKIPDKIDDGNARLLKMLENGEFYWFMNIGMIHTSYLSFFDTSCSKLDTKKGAISGFFYTKKHAQSRFLHEKRANS